MRKFVALEGQIYRLTVFGGGVAVELRRKGYGSDLVLHVQGDDAARLLSEVDAANTAPRRRALTIDENLSWVFAAYLEIAAVEPHA